VGDLDAGDWVRASGPMNNRPVTAGIERDGHSPSVTTALSVGDVAGIIRDLEGESDVTVEVFWQDVTDERVLLGINGADVSLRMVRIGRTLDDLYQYVAHGNDHRQGMIEFIVSGQLTNIRSRYVVNVETAAMVVQEWLTSGYASSSFGRWEHA
jgi:hypothetical protein